MTVVEPIFRLVCRSSALPDAAEDWIQPLLLDGELALLPDADGLAGVTRVAHELGFAAVSVVRAEETAEAQERTVIEHAGDRALVWVDSEFSDDASAWARRRGPMTLLVEADGPLPAQERRRIERFVAILGRQSD